MGWEVKPEWDCKAVSLSGQVAPPAHLASLLCQMPSFLGFDRKLQALFNPALRIYVWPTDSRSEVSEA